MNTVRNFLHQVGYIYKILKGCTVNRT